MKTKIRVYGKSQSRTALGIINAYLKLYPDATLSDLQQAFPKSLNSKGPAENIIVPVNETVGYEKQFFEREDELIVLKNGKKLALVEVWTKEDYNAICEHAKQYGIEVAEIESTKPFQKGSYELEYLNEFVPAEEITPVPENDGKKKRKFKWWWIVLLLLVLLLLILLLCCWKKCCCDDKCAKPDTPSIECLAPATAITNPVDKVVDGESDALIADTGDVLSLTLPDGKECTIDKSSPEYKLFAFLNSDDAKVDEVDKTKGWITLDQLHFETGKTKLTDESETQLKNVAMIMNFFPNSHIKMGGYTDNTGTDAVNMRISSERAKVAAEKLIASGVDASRVAHEGYGSTYPVCPANDTDDCRATNRRIDIRVTRK